MITRDDMWHKACETFESWACKYADKNVTDEQFFCELCGSLYAGEEFYETEPEPVKLDENYNFKYKSYTFELTPCTLLTTKQQVLDTADKFRQDGTKGIFTDRYVCWMIGHKNIDGQTEEESDDPAFWAPAVHLIPNAWAWGAESDCNPGDTVQGFILKEIDEFLKQNPDL